jgi:hypothetical protein
MPGNNERAPARGDVPEPGREGKLSGTEPTAVQREPQVQAFDYAVLPTDHAKVAQAAASSIRVSHRRVTSDILAIGRHLCAVKEVLDHGQFGAWLKAEFSWSDRTARNFMAAWAAFGEKSETVSDLPPATLYALAAPSTPEPVRKAIVERLEAGERIEPRAIAGMISQAKDDARKAAKEAKLTDQERKRRKEAAKRKKKNDERQRKEWEQRKEQDEARRKQELEASFQMVDLMVEVFGDRLPELAALLDKAAVLKVRDILHLRAQGHDDEYVRRHVTLTSTSRPAG